MRGLVVIVTLLASPVFAGENSQLFMLGRSPENAITAAANAETYIANEGDNTKSLYIPLAMRIKAMYVVCEHGPGATTLTVQLRNGGANLTGSCTMTGSGVGVGVNECSATGLSTNLAAGDLLNFTLKQANAISGSGANCGVTLAITTQADAPMDAIIAGGGTGILYPSLNTTYGGGGWLLAGTDPDIVASGGGAWSIGSSTIASNAGLMVPSACTLTAFSFKIETAQNPAAIVAVNRRRGGLIITTQLSQSLSGSSAVDTNCGGSTCALQAGDLIYPIDTEGTSGTEALKHRRWVIMCNGIGQIVGQSFKDLTAAASWFSPRIVGAGTVTEAAMRAARSSYVGNLEGLIDNTVGGGVVTVDFCSGPTLAGIVCNGLSSSVSSPATAFEDRNPSHFPLVNAGDYFAFRQTAGFNVSNAYGHVAVEFMDTPPATWTSTITPTFTPTATPTITPTQTPTQTSTATGANTATPTVTRTFTVTVTSTPTQTPTQTPTATIADRVPDVTGPTPGVPDGFTVVAVHGSTQFTSTELKNKVAAKLGPIDTLCWMAQNNLSNDDIANQLETSDGTCDVGAAQLIFGTNKPVDVQVIGISTDDAGISSARMKAGIRASVKAVLARQAIPIPMAPVEPVQFQLNGAQLPLPTQWPPAGTPKPVPTYQAPREQSVSPLVNVRHWMRNLAGTGFVKFPYIDGERAAEHYWGAKPFKTMEDYQNPSKNSVLAGFCSCITSTDCQGSATCLGFTCVGGTACTKDDDCRGGNSAQYPGMPFCRLEPLGVDVYANAIEACLLELSILQPFWTQEDIIGCDPFYYERPASFTPYPGTTTPTGLVTPTATPTGAGPTGTPNCQVSAGCKTTNSQSSGRTCDKASTQFKRTLRDYAHCFGRKAKEQWGVIDADTTSPPDDTGCGVYLADGGKGVNNSECNMESPEFEPDGDPFSETEVQSTEFGQGKTNCDWERDLQHCGGYKLLYQNQCSLGTTEPLSGDWACVEAWGRDTPEMYCDVTKYAPEAWYPCMCWEKGPIYGVAKDVILPFLAKRVICSGGGRNGLSCMTGEGCPGGSCVFATISPAAQPFSQLCAETSMNVMGDTFDKFIVDASDANTSASKIAFWSCESALDNAAVKRDCGTSDRTCGGVPCGDSETGFDVTGAGCTTGAITCQQWDDLCKFIKARFNPIRQMCREKPGQTLSGPGWTIAATPTAVP